MSVPCLSTHYPYFPIFRSPYEILITDCRRFGCPIRMFPFQLGTIVPQCQFFKRPKSEQRAAGKSVTFVGSQTNEYGERMPVYPEKPAMSAHKILHVSPPPRFVFAACDRARGRGRQMVEGDFQAGKTYQLYCNLHYDDRYKIVAREVPNGTTMNTNHVMNIYYQNGQPTDANRIRFVLTGETENGLLAKINLFGRDRMSILGWNGKFSSTAELAAPANRVIVRCYRSSEFEMVDVKSDFQAGKTYRLDCKMGDDKQMSAFIAEVM